MIKLKELLEKYGDYEVNEEKLEEILLKPKTKTIWNIERCDWYFAIIRGKVCKLMWKGDPLDLDIRDSGDAFLTEQEAKFELERRKVEEEMLSLGGTRDFWSIGCARVKKYYLIYNHKKKKSYVCHSYDYHNLGQICFPSEEAAKNAIKIIGESRIKKYLFYAEDVEDKEND